jgi:hypothetical protein
VDDDVDLAQPVECLFGGDVGAGGEGEAGEVAQAVVGVSPWTLVMPAWPVAKAQSIAIVSGPRHSPTMIRLGLRRSALETSCSRVTPGRPSRLSGRDS